MPLLLTVVVYAKSDPKKLLSVWRVLGVEEKNGFTRLSEVIYGLTYGKHERMKRCFVDVVVYLNLVAPGVPSALCG